MKHNKFSLIIKQFMSLSLVKLNAINVKYKFQSGTFLKVYLRHEYCFELDQIKILY